MFLTLMISGRPEGLDKVPSHGLNVWDVVVGTGGPQHVLLHGLSNLIPSFLISEQTRARDHILQLVPLDVAEHVSLGYVRDPGLVSVHHFLIFGIEEEKHVFPRKFDSDNISVLLVDLPPEPVHSGLVLFLSQQGKVTDQRPGWRGRNLVEGFESGLLCGRHWCFSAAAAPSRDDWS